MKDFCNVGLGVRLQRIYHRRNVFGLHQLPHTRDLSRAATVTSTTQSKSANMPPNPQLQEAGDFAGRLPYVVAKIAPQTQAMYRTTSGSDTAQSMTASMAGGDGTQLEALYLHFLQKCRSCFNNLGPRIYPTRIFPAPHSAKVFK